MTLDKAPELLKTQLAFGSGYNRNAAKLILAEVQREHGMVATDQLIRELDLETAFRFKPGEKITP